MGSDGGRHSSRFFRGVTRNSSDQMRAVPREQICAVAALVLQGKGRDSPLRARPLKKAAKGAE